jgi:uncharacterized alpha-E superfamily protein
LRQLLSEFVSIRVHSWFASEREDGAMLSRVAEALYWIGRYVERAENIARFADVNQYIALDTPFGDWRQWEPLVLVTGDHAEFHARHEKATREAVLDFLTFDKAYPSSIASCVRSARENARMIRDAITLETWEAINQFHQMVEDGSREYAGGNVSHEFYAKVRDASHLIHGIIDDTMARTGAWHFGRLGQMIERADKTTRLLDVKYFILLPSPDDVGSPLDEIQWTAVLRSASALEMYRKRHGRCQPERIIEFLLLDRIFPRSVFACIHEARTCLHAISGTPIGSFSVSPEQRLGRLHARLSYSAGDEIVAGGMHEFLDDLQLQLNLIDRDIFEVYFALAPVDLPPPEAAMAQEDQ